MRPICLARLAPFALVALLALEMGCAGAGSKRLQGSWRGLRSDGVPANAAIAANAFALSMKLDVNGDGITVTTLKDKQTGRYKVVREDKAAVVIMTDRDGPRDPQTFTFLDDKTMRWAVADGAGIVFQKQ